MAGYFTLSGQFCLFEGALPEPPDAAGNDRLLYVSVLEPAELLDISAQPEVRQRAPAEGHVFDPSQRRWGREGL